MSFASAGRSFHFARDSLLAASPDDFPASDGIGINRTTLSAATHYSTLRNLKVFFKWLADKPGYKSRISHADAEYFNPSEKETRIAKSHRDGRAPTIEQIRCVLESCQTNPTLKSATAPWSLSFADQRP